MMPHSGRKAIVCLDSGRLLRPDRADPARKIPIVLTLALLTGFRGA